MTLRVHVLAALPDAPPGLTAAEVRSVVRRAVPGATDAEVIEALGRLGTGRADVRQVECATRRDERGAWVSRWWRVR